MGHTISWGASVGIAEEIEILELGDAHQTTELERGRIKIHTEPKSLWKASSSSLACVKVRQGDFFHLAQILYSYPLLLIIPPVDVVELHSLVIPPIKVQA